MIRPILAILLICVINAFAAEMPRRVLIVHSFGREFSPYSEIARNFRTKLAEISGDPIEFMDASLEMARFDGPKRDQPLVDFLNEVYRDEKPDLIVPIGAQAAMFTVRHRKTVFPETPILMLSVDTTRLSGLIDQPDVASVGIDLDVDAYIGNILRLCPKTKHIFVVMGTAPLEQFWEKALRRKWAAFEDRVTFHWLSEQPLEQMKKTVASLPPHSALLMGIVTWMRPGFPTSRSPP